MATSYSIGKHFENAADAFDQSIRGRHAVCSDKRPDRIEVEVGLRKFSKSIRHVCAQPIAAVPAP